MASATAPATTARARPAPAATAPADLGRLLTSLTAATAEGSLVNLAPHRLSALEYGILDRCFRGEAQTVTELASLLPGDAPMMSRHVSKLVDRGLMGRTRLLEDRRTVRLRLTRTLTSKTHQEQPLPHGSATGDSATENEETRCEDSQALLE